MHYSPLEALLENHDFPLIGMLSTRANISWPTSFGCTRLNSVIEAIRIRIRFVEGILDQTASHAIEGALDQAASLLERAALLLRDNAIEGAPGQAASLLPDEVPQNNSWFDTLAVWVQEIREKGLDETKLATLPVVKFLRNSSTAPQPVTFQEKQYYEFCHVVCYHVAPEISLLVAYCLSEKNLRGTYTEKAIFILQMMKNKELLSCEVLKHQARKLSLYGPGM